MYLFTCTEPHSLAMTRLWATLISIHLYPCHAVGGVEVVGELLDGQHTGVFDFPARDLLQSAARHSRASGDDRPRPFRRQQTRHHKLMQRKRPHLKMVDPNEGQGKRKLNGDDDPHSGLGASQNWDMSDKTRVPKIPGFDRAILADNVRKLMEHHFPMAGDRPRRLAKEAQVSLSSIQRIYKGEVGANLDTIEAVARALSLSAYQLLIPDLDPANPQTIPGAVQAERRLYRRWQVEVNRGTQKSDS